MENLTFLIENLDKKVKLIEEINDIVINTVIPILQNNTTNSKCITKNIEILIQKYNSYSDFIEFYTSKIMYYTTHYFILKKIDNNNKMKNNKSYTDLLGIIPFEEFIPSDINDIKEIDIAKLRRDTYFNFNNFLSSNDVYGKLDNYEKFINRVINYFVDKDQFSELLAESNALLQKKFNDYSKIITSYITSTIKYDICICGNKMVVRPNTSDLICTECGYLQPLLGDVFENHQFFSQDNGVKYIHGNYVPSRHCKYWIDRIQAKENTEIKEEYIEKIRDRIERDGIKNKKNISIIQYRKYLKETKLSSLNDHIPLIRKHITGIIPPQLSHIELNLLFNYFDKTVKIYKIIKPSTKSNSLYYPYTILKILEVVIKDPKKKKELISCIHLQGNKTLVDNDKNWKLICEKFTDIKYKSTDRNEYI